MPRPRDDQPRVALDNRPVDDSKAQAEDFVHFFVGMPRYLTMFLEGVRAQCELKKPLLNTLLELYLREPRDVTGDEKSGPEPRATTATVKIMTLLKGQKKPNLRHALVLTKMYGFEPGTLYLYDELKLYQELLMHHMEKDEPAKVIATCKKHSNQEKDLWVQALAYFAAKPEANTAHITTVLTQIKENNLLPPLTIVQMLKDKPLAVVRQYIIETLTQENDTIALDKDKIDQLQEETQLMRKEIENIRTRPKIFQGNKCRNFAECKQPLTLPAVHFLCMHSYHIDCVGDDHQCPECAPEYRKGIVHFLKTI